MQAAGDLMALVQMRDAKKPLGWIGQALVQAALANWTAAANLATHAIQTTFHVRERYSLLVQVAPQIAYSIRNSSSIESTCYTNCHVIGVINFDSDSLSVLCSPAYSHLPTSSCKSRSEACRSLLFS